MTALHTTRTAFLGIDVSKERLCCLIRTHEVPRLARGSFKNTLEGIRELQRWACDSAQCTPQQVRVALEVSGVFHEVAAQQLHAWGCEVVVCNPGRTRKYAQGLGRQHKTDPVDAEVLADYARSVPARCFRPVPEEIGELRELLHRRQVLKRSAAAESRRLEATSYRCLPSAVRDSILRSYRASGSELEWLARAQRRFLARHPQLNQERKLLMSIPGVGEVVSIHLLCLLKQYGFSSAREAAAMAGLVPVEHSSGHSHRSPRLRPTGHRTLRTLLFISAVRSMRRDPHWKSLFEDLLDRGKPRGRARVAMMRRIVHIGFGILKHRRPYRFDWAPQSQLSARALEGKSTSSLPSGSVPIL